MTQVEALRSSRLMIGYFRGEIEKAGISMRSRYDFPDLLAAPSVSEIDQLAEKSGSLEQRISSLNDSYEILRKREIELTEWRWVLTEAGGFFDRVVFDLVLHVYSLLTMRLMATPKKSVSPLIMTRLRCCKTWNNRPVARMGTGVPTHCRS